MKHTKENAPAAPEKKTRARRTNLIFAAVVLLLALILLAVRLWWQAHAGPDQVAVLTYSAQDALEIDLRQERTIDVDTGSYTIHVQVQDGKIAFVDSPCPDHVCEAFGWLEKEGDWAACMPAGAFLEIESR